ncbi:MAG: iron-containing alcohol dehydrogenase [Proteobacteria bacterium]|nr:iron-containing alcohol dehydrogenase [Pseudomonadota bacterium]
MAYEFSLSTKIIIGEGCSGQVGEKAAATGAKKVMCIFDKGVLDAGIVGPILENLEGAGIKVIQYGGVLPDPPMEVIEECTGIAKHTKPDAFVAIGGGSSIDTAKAVNANLGNPGSLKDHAINLNGLKILPFDNPLNPLLVLPTTAGTGSEVSPSSVVTDKEIKIKMSVMSPDLQPDIAIIDPALMKGLPPHITASTGLDAFSHAVEGLMGGLALFTPSPMRESFSFTAIGLVLKSLVPSIKDGNNIQARSDMAYAAFLSILGANGGLSLGHTIGHAIGEVSDIHNHGFLCASIIPYNVHFLAGHFPTQIRKLASLMGLDVAGKSPSEIGSDVKQAIKEFYKACGVPTLKEMGLNLSDGEEIVHHTTSGIWCMLAPQKPTKEEILGWLQQAYEK